MNRIPVSSSNLRSVGYDASQYTLEIEFHNGSIYQYFNVPQVVYQGLLAASSHGQYFDQHIRKAGYSLRKIR